MARYIAGIFFVPLCAWSPRAEPIVLILRCSRLELRVQATLESGGGALVRMALPLGIAQFCGLLATVDRLIAALAIDFPRARYIAGIFCVSLCAWIPRAEKIVIVHGCSRPDPCVQAAPESGGGALVRMACPLGIAQIC